MIFNPITVCECVFCEEYDGDFAIAAHEAALCVVLVSRGEARVTNGKSSVRAKAGALVLASGGVSALPQGDCHLIMAGLGGSAPLQGAQNVGELLLSNSGVCPLAPQLLAALTDALLSKTQAARTGYELLCELQSADEAQASIQPLVANAISAMRKNFAGLYGVEELSLQLAVSKSHLVRVFSHEMGVPPGQYLTAVRVNEAKKLLCTRNYPLELIATLCGFSGANYLCKVFKKHTGQTCAEYRAAAKLQGTMQELSEQESILYI
ncbi:MAG: AraC family transcriptional regulator [Oscillospiraceae bacterium]